MTLSVERWHGDPAEEQQPDVGDVLAYVDPEQGYMFVGPVMLVRHARPIRGREHEPHELMLTLEEGDMSHLQEPEGTIFTAIKNRRRRRSPRGRRRY